MVTVKTTEESGNRSLIIKLFTVWPLVTFPNIYFSLIKETLPLIMQLIFKINYFFQFKMVAPFNK